MQAGRPVPLSDFGSQGAAIRYKAWACTNPECGFNIKIRNGDLYIDEPIASGALHSPRAVRRSTLEPACGAGRTTAGLPRYGGAS